jgi:ribonuclease BN (tRNA processing enzyme)
MKKIILLGTGGGPRIWAARSQPSSALIVNDDIYIIDTGDGVCNQLAKANLDPLKIKCIFITHNHSDHMADLGTLLLRTWQSGHKGIIKCFGPKPLNKMISSYCEYMSWDINLRTENENRPYFKTVFNINEITEEKIIYRDEKVKVECITVPHGEAVPSYAYKFYIDNKEVVFSGDTSKSEKIIKFSNGVDYLVHEVLNLEGVDDIINRTYPGNKEFRKHIIDGHTSTKELGILATKANVKNLVLNHLVPTGSPKYDLDKIWLKELAINFDGNVIVGKDLLEINL